MTKTTQTWNGAPSLCTSSFEKFGACLDYFSKCGTYTNRTEEQVNSDMVRIFNDDAPTALKLVFGVRLISRKIDNKVQVTGFGRRDEFYKCVKWLVENDPETLYKNLHLIPVFGSCKDLIEIATSLDFTTRDHIYHLVAKNFDDPLLLKYLPQIRSTSQIRTERDKKRIDWAKGLCKYLGITFKQYRKFKSKGAAHIWQKQMGRNDWDNINFSGIPGKALLNHISRKGKKDKKSVFERHNQIERLKEWVLAQKNVKFTGYPYELLRAASKPSNIIQKTIYDKQFETILEPFKNHKLGNVLSCLDISGSMGCSVLNDVSAMDVCLSMGLVFSALNFGHFKDVVCGFSDSPIILKLAGGFCDRLNTLKTDRKFQQVAWGSTNFQGVIDMLCQIKLNNPEIPTKEFPDTLLVLSDMQFNPAPRLYWTPTVTQLQTLTDTNYEVARKKLNDAGLKEMRIIWWFLNGEATDFPSNMDDKGVYMIGGFDPVNLMSLLGLNIQKNAKIETPNNSNQKVSETPLDGMMNFLSQPIFNLIEV